MREIWEDHNRKIAEIDKRTKKEIRLTFICSGIFIVIIIYFGFFY